MKINKVINHFFDFLYSTKTMAIALIIFILAMAAATFIENDFGTSAAKAMIYNTKWFELLLFLLTINFIGNIFIFKLYKKEKWPSFLFHLAFIIILLGAFITRYYSFEGIMHIREGEKSNTIYSDKAYFNLSVNDGKWKKDYHYDVLFSKLGNTNIINALIFNNRENKFEIEDEFGKKNPKDFKIKLIEYIPKAKENYIKDSSSTYVMHLVQSDHVGRKDYLFKEGDIKSINNILFTFNKPIDGAVNIFTKEGVNYIQTPFDGKLMDMKTQKIYPVKKDSTQELTLLQLYNFNDELKFFVKDIFKGKIVLESASKSEESKYPFDYLKINIQSGNENKDLELRGATGGKLYPESVKLNGLNFEISYGSKEYKTPFYIYLKDFVMNKYPGTKSPSSFESYVRVEDPDKTFDYKIYMNHVLDYKKYRFYQASYDMDEKGTVLSVNHDFWGTLVTYIGYFLMSVGMFFALFWKGTTYQKLAKKVNEISRKNFGAYLVYALITISSFNLQAQTNDILENAVSKQHAEKFGKLLIQDHRGRIKPVNTYALESLRKIYKKDKYKGLTAEQVLLSAQVRPRFWAHQKIIKTNPYALGSELASKLNINDSKYVNLISFFNGGKYILEDKVAEAFRKSSSQRNQSDKEIINLDEKVNIWMAILQGSLLKIYPKKDDPNNTWYTGINSQVFTGQDSMVVHMHKLYMNELNNAIKTGNYTKANEYLSYIADYQKKVGAEVIPSDKKIKAEILYNKIDVFKELLFYYMILGFIILILAFIDLFKPGKKIVNKLILILSGFVVIGVLVHAFGIGLRWYITGHEPLSNGYEATVFLAFVIVIAGLIYSYKKNKLTLASAVIFSSFLLGIAHGSMMNPEMTPLVPVLKSYWLLIHVAVITASYAFLGLSALLGFIVLLLFILMNDANKKRFNAVINELTAISEMSMIVGLYTLSIGTFLGGIWANESWGRYWSWDPKETWSLISMMVFTLILHFRIIPGLKGKFVYNTAALWGITALIMTFFGVNYYLSGMHSYAAGEPVPIPDWVPYAIGFFLLFTFYSYYKYKKIGKLKNSQ